MVSEGDSFAQCECTILETAWEAEGSHQRKLKELKICTFY
jgi:hypothetical protein